MPERVGEGLRALVVDDEEVVRSVVVEVLEGMGFLATPAESLTAGRQKLAVDRYDLLIIDKNLPDGSGLSMAHEVAERSLDAQVVIISGYATLSSAVEALQTGVADFVVKPFDLADFSFAAGARPICPPTSRGATCWRVSAATPSPSCCRRPTVPARRLAPSTSGVRSSRRSSVPDCRASPSPSELPPFPSTRRMPMGSSLPPRRRSTRQSKPGGIGSSAGPESCRQAAVWIRRRCGMKP